jgi:AcrR family transcriptional regulator
MSAEERRVSILAAAREAFMSSGYGGARTRDIAQRAGVNEALLFRHFATKEDIFRAAVVEPLITAMQGPLADASPVVDDDAATEQKKASSYATLRQMLEILQETAPLLGIALFADNEQAKVFYREQITPILEAGSARLRKRYGTWDHRDYDPDLMPRISMGMCLFITLDAYFTGRQLDLDTTAAELADLIVYGTASRPDHPTARPQTATARRTTPKASRSRTAAAARSKISSA